MIRISIGNVGSGKTICEVREMIMHSDSHYYTNIKAKIDNITTIDHNSIFFKEKIVEGKKEKTVYQVNTEYWKNAITPCSVVLDEAHNILNPRKSMSKVNIAVTDWMAMIRRILGETEGTGELVLITQLPRRIDVISREMATEIRYHICHYHKICLKCNNSFKETSDQPEKLRYCPICGHGKIKKTGHQIEILKFQSMDQYNAWKIMGTQTYYKRYMITNINRFFGTYETLQWESMISQAYSEY